MNPLSKLLLVTALLVAVVGVGLVVVQPGGLGDGDSEAETAQPDITEPAESSTSTSTTEPGGDTTSTTPAGSDDGATTTSTTSASPSSTPPTTAATTTTTTAPGGGTGGGGSGLAGGDAAPADTEDGLANSGGTSLMAAALLVGLAGLAIRHRPTA